MTTTLQSLIEAARQTKMTAEQRETQRQSFAFGNTHFENDEISRETVRRASELLRGQQHASEFHAGQPG